MEAHYVVTISRAQRSSHGGDCYCGLLEFCIQDTDSVLGQCSAQCCVLEHFFRHIELHRQGLSGFNHGLCAVLDHYTDVTHGSLGIEIDIGLLQEHLINLHQVVSHPIHYRGDNVLTVVRRCYVGSKVVRAFYEEHIDLTTHHVLTRSNRQAIEIQDHITLTVLDHWQARSRIDHLIALLSDQGVVSDLAVDIEVEDRASDWIGFIHIVVVDLVDICIIGLQWCSARDRAVARPEVLQAATKEQADLFLGNRCNAVRQLELTQIRVDSMGLPGAAHQSAGRVMEGEVVLQRSSKSPRVLHQHRETVDPDVVCRVYVKVSAQCEFKHPFTSIGFASQCTGEIAHEFFVSWLESQLYVDHGIVQIAISFVGFGFHEQTIAVIDLDEVIPVGIDLQLSRVVLVHERRAQGLRQAQVVSPYVKYGIRGIQDVVEW